MYFLDARRLTDNMDLAVAHLAVASSRHPGATKVPGGLKRRFISAINVAQGTNLSCDTDIRLEFDDDRLTAFLVENGVFSTREVAGGAHHIPKHEQLHAATRFAAAMRLIARADKNLATLIENLIGSVAAYRIRSRDGGSVSSAIGLIWLSPKQSWTVEYWAEMIVHEFVHNSVFLEDMIRGILPEPAFLNDALCLSAIRKQRRPFDKAFHSACVAAAIMYLYYRLSDEPRALSYVSATRDTIDDCLRTGRAFRASGRLLLTDNGLEILQQLHAFARGEPNFAVISAALDPMSPALRAPVCAANLPCLAH